MLVGPPGDACSVQLNLDLCAVGVIVKQLQCVCHQREDGGLETILKIILISCVWLAEQESGSPLNMLLAMAPHGAIGLFS